MHLNATYASCVHAEDLTLTRTHFHRSKDRPITEVKSCIIKLQSRSVLREKIYQPGAGRGRGFEFCMPNGLLFATGESRQMPRLGLTPSGRMPCRQCLSSSASLRFGGWRNCMPIPGWDDRLEAHATGVSGRAGISGGTSKNRFSVAFVLFCLLLRNPIIPSEFSSPLCHSPRRFVPVAG